MKIGNGDIKEVEKKVNDKVKEMKLPGSKVKNPIAKNPEKTPNL
ncbi:hypothetical protein [Wolbachia endosymbiont of Mansonella perstans]|nr:hypothetical protein [Wolbachia endosymbiont of Mansonella perstans]